MTLLFSLASAASTWFFCIVCAYHKHTVHFCSHPQHPRRVRREFLNDIALLQSLRPLRGFVFFFIHPYHEHTVHFCSHPQHTGRVRRGLHRRAFLSSTAIACTSTYQYQIFIKPYLRLTVITVSNIDDVYSGNTAIHEAISVCPGYIQIWKKMI